jgi:hypothetical protein
VINGAQIRAARAMVRWTRAILATRSKLPVETIRRIESADAEAPLTAEHENAVKSAFATAGLEFLSDGGPGVRLKTHAPPDEGLRPQELTAENDG